MRHIKKSKREIYLEILRNIGDDIFNRRNSFINEFSS